MKKILMISHVQIFGHGGGCIENRKYFYGLKHFAKLNNAEVKVVSLDNPFENSFDIVVKKNKLMDISARMLGHSTYLYFIWKRYNKKIIEYSPDLIVIGRSRMGFIAKDIKKKMPYCKVIINMENVEYDFVDAYFANSRGLFKSIYSKLEKSCVKRDEKNSITYADALNYLTKRDYQRTHELYKCINKIETIIPICIEKKTHLLNKSELNKTIVFVGSLGYGANQDALEWFIDNIWKRKYIGQNDIKFVIGGNNASNELIEKISGITNIAFYNNFEKLEDIIPKDAMLIAPIQSGAGMKVKVAEALSMGIPVVASDEALQGYENSISLLQGRGIFRANEPEEYINVIEDYRSWDLEKMESICIENSRVYEMFYSYEVSQKNISDLCKNLLHSFIK